MQSVLSERFENRIINLDQYASAASGSTALQDLMTIKDIKRVDQLQVFATFVVDQLYPRIRSSSGESSYFNHDLEEPKKKTKVVDETANANADDAGATGTRRL